MTLENIFQGVGTDEVAQSGYLESNKDKLSKIIADRTRELNLFVLALQIYGNEAQLRQLQEECAELIVAINHHLRKPTPEHYNELVEEVVDAQIVLDQIKLTIDKKTYRDIYNTKVARLAKKLSERKIKGEIREEI